MTALLQVESLSVRYGPTRALQAASIEVGQREVVALVGANGAGKSSMLNALLGLVPQAGGSVLLAGRRIEGLSTRDRIAAGLALSPEGRRVFPDLSVEDNLDLGDLGRDLAARREQRESVYRWFPRLLERRGQLAGTMSGGRPRVLMLDEPTLGLAPVIVREIANFIRHVRSAGVSVLIAEQNAEMALGAADRAYVLQNGEVVMSGGAREMAAHPDVRAAYLGL